MRASFLSFAAVLLFDTAHASTDHSVTVGKGGQLKFDPESLTAKVGDTVTYSFFSKNHAVAQSSFDSPCQQLDNGLFSGFTPNESESVAAPTTFTITIEDEKPLWLYCPQTTGDHCQKKMVHAINAPTEGNTLEAYKTAATSAATSTSPKDGLPVGGLRTLHVDVGLDGFTFTPSDIKELVGTTVQFSFNPKNHTVTQSSFDKPCQQLDGGFSSGFIPASESPSGVLFDIQIKDIKPLWFYCGQPTGDHCQKGMVGSINAPTEGNTFTAFKDLAAKAPPSVIAPTAPIGGVLTVDGVAIKSLDGNILNGGGGNETDTGDGNDGSTDSGKGGDKGADNGGWKEDYVKEVPKPGDDNNQYMMGMAGGGTVTNYGWGDSITDDAVKFLQLLQWFDNILLAVLSQGYHNLDGGEWKGQWPQTIVDTVGSMAAQAYMHRTTATDALQHYDKSLSEWCSYKLSLTDVEAFLDLVLTVLLLEMGLLLDIITNLAKTDSWLVPAIASTIGSKGRMLGVVNLMQNHMAAAAPREVAIPAQFVYAYAASNYIDSCPSNLDGWSKPKPVLTVTETINETGTTRVAKIKVDYEADTGDLWAVSGDQWVAFLGPWGVVHFSPVADDMSVEVPTDLYGHVWIVLTSKGEAALEDLWSVTVAGPAKVWISQP